MIMQKLTWAGVAISCEGTTILIDPIGNTSDHPEKPLAARMGEPRETIFPLTHITNVSSIFVTHLHPDHFDPDAISAVFGSDIPVHVPEESVESARKTGLRNVVGLSAGEKVNVGTLRVTAAPSVDGFGAPQVAWIVTGGGRNVIHCGDTLWHGYWWRIARQHGPIEAAFLPVNGAVLHIPGLPEQSSLPACMTPEEAVEAARLLGAGRLVPIHYHTFHHPPFYIETPNLIERLTKRAQERAVHVALLEPGEKLEV